MPTNVAHAARSRAALLVAALAMLDLAGCDGAPAVDAGPVDACPPGTADCPCAATAPSCAIDLVCVAGACEACTFGTRGCPCADEANVESGCESGDLCDDLSTTCRAPTVCEDAGCPQRRLCEQIEGADAVCLEECEPGFSFDAVTGACTAIPSCDADAPGSIVDVCELEHRVCDATLTPDACAACLEDFVEVDDVCVTDDCDGLDCDGRLGRACVEALAGPTCTDCLATHVVDPGADACIDRVTCAELSCGADDCIEATATVDAACVAPADCPDGEVESEPGTCVACVECFDDGGPLPVPLAGVAGVGNAGRIFEEKCVCDVLPGFFQDLGGSVHACDGDGDGWVTSTLIPVIERVGTNAHGAEQECTVRRVDRFELVADDANLPSEVATRVIPLATLIATYGIPASAIDSNAFGFSFVSLFEPEDLDNPALFDDRYDTPAVPALFLRPYGALAERFSASEANPFTKSCNDDDDDLNLDGLKDASQPQEAASFPSVTTSGVASMPVFARLAFFLELARGSYVDADADCGDPECFGAWRIAEKARSATAAPEAKLELAYALDEDAYWQSCVRSRPPHWEGAVDVPIAANQDFARWVDCASLTGTCRVDEGRGPHVPYDGRDPNLTSSFGALPADPIDGSGRFPGMNHASQFRCVTFNPAVDAASPRRIPRDVHTVENPDGAIALDVCDLGGPGRTSDGPPTGTSAVNARDPQMRCAAATNDAQANARIDASTRQNHWVALRMPAVPYANTAAYPGGCIDEAAEWGPFLCVDDPVARQQDAFGRLFCGCGANRGGASCEVTCDEPSLHSTRVVDDDDEVIGSWLCLKRAASPVTIGFDAASSRTLVGTVPFVAGPSRDECQFPGQCDTGFALRPVPPIQ